MTAVCVFVYHHIPMMIGDLAVSSGEPESGPAQVPTRKKDQNPFPVGSGYVIKDLAQKVVRLAPYFVMGWAGSEIHARALARQLIPFLNDRRRDINEIRSFLLSYDQNDLKDTQVLGMYCLGEKIDFVGGNSADFQEVDTRYPGGYIGVGGQFLYADINSLKSRGNQVPDSRGSMPAENNHLAKCCGLVAGLVRKEVTESFGFRHYYGGGYELSSFNSDGKFEKLDDVTFAFWDIIIDSQTGTEFNYSVIPVHMSRYLYIEDILNIKSLHFSEISKDRLKIEETQLFRIHPLLSDSRRELPKDFFINSKVICSHVSVFIKGISQSICALVANDVGAPEKPFLQIHQIDEETISYQLNQDELNNMIFRVVFSMPPKLRAFIPRRSRR